MLNQFSNVSRALEDGSGFIHVIRSNYGVGIIPTAFGCNVFKMPYEMNTLPNVKSLPVSLPDVMNPIRRLIESDLPSHESGFGQHVFSVGAKYMEIKEKYPKIGKYVRVDHPDCQGPFDICELLYGSDIFVQLYDEPDLIHALLRKVTDYYKIFLDKWFAIVPNIDKYHSFFGALHKGSICVRDDSAMNLSPDFYDEFVFPYDYEVLRHFGGGMVHFCGRGDHYIKNMSAMDCLFGVDLSQPHYNDMEVILQNTIDKGIALITVKGDYYDTIARDPHRLSMLALKDMI